MGYDIVSIRLMDSGGRKTLQIMAERRDSKEMSVDDCADISRTVSALLDVEDPITTAYSLEVSSPGIDRPLIKPEDFVRFVGYEAKIETTLPLDGRKRFKGKIQSATDKVVVLELSDGSAEIKYATIHFAKLVLTDELVREHLRKHKKGTKH